MLTGKNRKFVRQCSISFTIFITNNNTKVFDLIMGKRCVYFLYFFLVLFFSAEQSYCQSANKDVFGKKGQSVKVRNKAVKAHKKRLARQMEKPREFTRREKKAKKEMERLKKKHLKNQSKKVRKRIKKNAKAARKRERRRKKGRR